MLRRTFLALVTVSLHAEKKPPVYALLSSLSSYFSEGNGPGAITAFAKTMPGYASIEANIMALTAQADILCVIELIDEEGDEQKRKAEVSWFLEIKSKESNGPTERREQNVKLAFEKQGNDWKIVSIDPASILDPLKIA